MTLKVCYNLGIFRCAPTHFLRMSHAPLWVSSEFFPPRLRPISVFCFPPTPIRWLVVRLRDLNTSFPRGNPFSLTHLPTCVLTVTLVYGSLLSNPIPLNMGSPLSWAARKFSENHRPRSDHHRSFRSSMRSPRLVMCYLRSHVFFAPLTPP